MLGWRLPVLRPKRHLLQEVLAIASRSIIPFDTHRAGRQMSGRTTGKGISDRQASAQSPKYCSTCGRLISKNHASFSERRYCSHSCGKSRLGPFDRELEEFFTKRALAKGSAYCEDVQRSFEETALGPASLEQTKQAVGMAKARFRERVRRAGRRVVVFPNPDGLRFECVQNGKAVEPSFAKGEWAVRPVKGNVA